jgi:hypothetical protein
VYDAHNLSALLTEHRLSEQSNAVSRDRLQDQPAPLRLRALGVMDYGMRLRRTRHCWSAMTSRYLTCRMRSWTQGHRVVHSFNPDQASAVGSCISCRGTKVQSLLGAFICQDRDTVCGSYIDSPEWRSTPQTAPSTWSAVVGGATCTQGPTGCTMSTSRADSAWLSGLRSRGLAWYPETGSCTIG